MSWTIVCTPVGNNPGRPNPPEGDDEEIPQGKPKRRLPWQRESKDASADAPDGVNMSAMVVQLANSDGFEQEVSRVGFVRRNTKNPEVEFGDQLTVEIDKAQTAKRVLDEQLTSIGLTV